MSKIKNALKALGGAEMKEENKVSIPIPEEHYNRVETQNVTVNASNKEQSEQDEIFKSVMEINFISGEDVAELSSVELKAIELNLLASILKEVKK